MTKLRTLRLLVAVVVFPVVFLLAASSQNPVPFLNQPLVPDAVAPGGPAFTLTVNGTGFVASSTVNWNGSPLATTFISGSQLTAAVPASDIATASTASVTVVSPSPGGGSSIPLFFPIAVPEASVSFTKQDFPSGPGNINVVTADFNGDGILDLATADYYNSVVQIFLGNGDGTFRPGQTYAACHAHGLAIGDFNGDGIVDLAVADAGCGEVTILLGNGDGTFTEGGNFSTGGDGIDAPYSVAVGDFNGDGKPDLVTADEILNQSSVLIGNGDGTFQPYVAYTTGDDSRKVVIGDFNRDGHLDFAVSGSAGVSVLLGNGDGTFQPQIFYPFASNDNPYMLTADLNGDGILDLAVASTGGSSGTDTAGFVSVMLGKGDGTFNSPVVYPTNGYSVAVEAADFKGNGVLDLVTTNYYASNISLLSGNGDGTFGPYVNYPGDDGARGVIAADFNGDGRLDLAVGDQFVNFISIYLQAPTTVTLSTTSLSFGNVAVDTSSAAKTVTLENTGTVALSIANIAIAQGTNFKISSNTCGSVLAAGKKCKVSVTFTPTQLGALTDTLSFTDNAANSPQTVALSGTSVAQAALTPASYTFEETEVGNTSAAHKFTLKNNLPTTLTGISYSAAAPFAVSTSTCTTTLDSKKSCTISVTFSPTAAGTASGTLTVADSANNSPQTVSLTGTGTSEAVYASPTSVDFADQSVGTTSGPTKVDLFNEGSQQITVTSVSASGDFSITENYCMDGVKPNSHCYVDVVFSPTESGPLSGTLTFVDNASGSPQTASLSGTGD